MSQVVILRRMKYQFWVNYPFITLLGCLFLPRVRLGVLPAPFPTCWQLISDSFFPFQTFMNEAAWGKTSNLSQICVHTLILMNQNPSRGLLSRGQRGATLAYRGSYHLPEHVPSVQFSSLVYALFFPNAILHHCVATSWEKSPGKLHAACAQWMRITQHTVECSL